MAVYIYVPSGGNQVHNADKMVTGNSGETPFCYNGNENLITMACNITPSPLKTIVGEPIDIADYVTCSEGFAPSVTSKTSTPTINWDSPAAGDYSNITVSGSCGSYPRQANCTGSIQVAAEPTCTGYSRITGASGTPSSTNYCPGLTWADVKFAAPGTSDGALPTGCYYVSSKNGFNFDGTWYLNGTQLSGGANTSAITPVDGGYYLYQPTGKTNYWSNLGSTHQNYGPEPFCSDGRHEIYCTGLAAGGTEGSNISEPTVTCRSGESPVFSFTGGFSFTSPVVGDYTVGVSGTCGNSETLTASCGPISIVTAGSLPPCAYEYQSSWCGGKTHSQVTTGTLDRPTVGQCIFYSDLSGSVQAGDGKLCVNNSCLTGFGNWWGKGDGNYPAVKDGGYYVYCEQATCIANGTQGLTPATAGSPSPTNGPAGVNCDAGGGGGSSSSAGGGESSSSGGGATCEYLSSYCNASGSTIKPVTAPSARPTATGCWYMTNYTALGTASSGGVIFINGTQCASGNTQSCAKPSSTKDGGYYVSLRSGGFSSNNGWTGVTAPSALPSGCTY